MIADDLPTPEKTLDAWQELGEVMVKHGFTFDMFKPIHGKGKRIAINLPNGQPYFFTSAKVLDGQALLNYVKDQRERDTQGSHEWWVCP